MSWSSSGGSDSDSVSESLARSRCWDSFSLRRASSAEITDAYRSAGNPGNSTSRTALRCSSPDGCTLPESPIAWTSALADSGVRVASSRCRSRPTASVVVKKLRSTLWVECEARMRAPTVKVSPPRLNSTQAKPVRVASSVPVITRSNRPPLDLAADVSRAGLASASRRNGSSSSRAIDFPDPFGPRKSRRPPWKVNVSSQYRHSDTRPALVGRHRSRVTGSTVSTACSCLASLMVPPRTGSVWWC